VDGILAHLKGFVALMASPGDPSYYDQGVQIPYEVR